MFEIQDAAKVITESIDPEAKIIFGTVRDDKLKKSEVKITVIATGFPDNRTPTTKSSVVSERPMIENNVREVPKEKVGDTKGKIYNSLSFGLKRQDKEEEKVIAKPEQNEEDDDWGAVPAFLRRSKLK